MRYLWFMVYGCALPVFGRAEIRFPLVTQHDLSTDLRPYIQVEGAVPVTANLVFRVNK